MMVADAAMMLLAEQLGAPLLGPGSSRSSSGSEVLPGGGTGKAHPRAAKETKKILLLGTPLVLKECLEYGSIIISMGFVGRLGAFSLGAFTLGRSVTNITGVALLNGITGGVDTFSSQAHGSGFFPAVGITLQMALILSLLACIPLMLLYWGIHPVLLALGQERHLAAAAARYILLYSPYIPLHAAVLCMYRTLASQGASMYMLAASATFCAVTAPINWLLVLKLGWGLDGSALAAVSAEVVYICCLATACALHNHRQVPSERWWLGWSRQALHDWGPFLRISLSAATMTVLDWWLYDINSLLAGLLPHPAVPMAATGVVYNINAIIVMVPLGLSYSVCARVGHHLGAARPYKAKLAASIGAVMGLVVALLPALLLLVLQNNTAALFTTDPAVLRAYCSLLLPLVMLIVGNGVTAVLSSILRACSRQKCGAWVNGSCNYGVGLPLQLLLGFYLGRGVAGLWWGLALAAVLQALLMGILVSRFDWDRELERAAKLVRHLSTMSESTTSCQLLKPDLEEGPQSHPLLIESEEDDGEGGRKAAVSPRS